MNEEITKKGKEINLMKYYALTEIMSNKKRKILK